MGWESPACGTAMTNLSTYLYLKMAKDGASLAATIRYYNENGIKLDMNGLIDYNKDMVIRLGHGSETSYWILMHQGHGRYVGTWGKKCKPSEVTFTFS